MAWGRIHGYSISERQQFVGEFTGKRNEQGMAEVAVKNKFLLGDEVEMMTPQGNIVFKIEKMLNRKNENVEAALGPPGKLGLEKINAFY